MSEKKPRKWKSRLLETDRQTQRLANSQPDAPTAEHLTWTAYGNVDKDPLTPLAGLPIEVLRVYSLSSAKPLAALARLPALEVVFFEACAVDASALIKAARAVPTLQVVMVRAQGETTGKLGARELAALPAWQALELQGVTLADDGIEAILEQRSLQELALLRGGSDKQKAVHVEGLPLRRLHLDLSLEELTLRDLPDLTELELAGSFDELRLEQVPQVETLELPIGERATLKQVGLKKLVATGLSSLTLTDAPRLATLDLRDCEDTLPAAKVAALRKAFPKAKVLG